MSYLPKPDKSKKAAPAVEQLDLVEKIDKADKIKKKRRLLYLSFFLTIGLSLAFWTYRSLNNIFTTGNFPTFSQLNFSLPSLNSSVSTLTKPVSLDSVVLPLLKNSKSVWNLYVSETPGSFTWSYQSSYPQEYLDNLQAELNRQLPTASTLISPALPSGVEVRQSVLDNGSSRDYNFLLTIPKKQILLVIKASGPDLESSPALVPELSSRIYWYLLQSNSD